MPAPAPFHKIGHFGRCCFRDVRSFIDASITDSSQDFFEVFAFVRILSRVDLKEEDAYRINITLCVII